MRCALPRPQSLLPLPALPLCRSPSPLSAVAPSLLPPVIASGEIHQLSNSYHCCHKRTFKIRRPCVAPFVQRSLKCTITWFPLFIKEILSHETTIMLQFHASPFVSFKLHKQDTISILRGKNRTPNFSTVASPFVGHHKNNSRHQFIPGRQPHPRSNATPRKKNRKHNTHSSAQFDPNSSSQNGVSVRMRRNSNSKQTVICCLTFRVSSHTLLPPQKTQTAAEQSGVFFVLFARHFAARDAPCFGHAPTFDSIRSAPHGYRQPRRLQTDT